MSFLTEVTWSPYVVGIAIGVLSWLSFLILRKPLSCSTSFASTSGMIERLLRGKKVELKPYYQKIKLKIDWQWMFVLGIVFGSLLSALLSGDFKLIWTPSLWASSFGETPVLRVLIAAESSWVLVHAGQMAVPVAMASVVRCNWRSPAGFLPSFSSSVASSLLCLFSEF